MRSRICFSVRPVFFRRPISALLMVAWPFNLLCKIKSTAESESPTDRKSTRLNSSHLVISYAVFCLKKKKNAYIIDIGSTNITLNATGGGLLSASTHLSHGATTTRRSNIGSNHTIHTQPHFDVL